MQTKLKRLKFLDLICKANKKRISELEVSGVGFKINGYQPKHGVTLHTVILKEIDDFKNLFLSK